MEKYRV
jgi:serine/threonine protein kinase